MGCVDSPILFDFEVAFTRSRQHLFAFILTFLATPRFPNANFQWSVQMGAAVWARDAPSPWHGGDGSGALLGATGAVPAAVRRRPRVLPSVRGRVRHQAALARQHDSGQLLAASLLLPHPEETGKKTFGIQDKRCGE